MLPGAEIHSPNSGDSTEGISPVEATTGAATVSTFFLEGSILEIANKEK